METQYDPKNVEERIYKLWEEGGYFRPEIAQNLPQNGDKGPQKAYSIVLPPPNITGTLHMGHALNDVIQDILIRAKRMQGYKTVWIPGIDHAGIATQNVVEKQLRKQDISRHQLGREKFLEKVWEWKKEYGGIILNQIRKIGASCDWTRCRFTMDEGYSKAVKTAFINYYEKGYVYRGKRVINWCTRCQTSLSDLEVEMEEEKGKLWYIKYPLNKEKTAFVTIATTRPETMLGDTALAVNPKDKRYKHLIGKKAILPLVNKEIPIVGDNAIDMEFGTGIIKVTPAHDFVDYKLGQTHKLEMIEVIDQFGKMNRNVPPQYQGLKATQAREKIVEDLKNADLLEKVEDYLHQVPRCARCNTIIEPMPSEQWFLKMQDLVKPAISAVKDKEVKFCPDTWEKPYFAWMENIQDWCLSRQLWWGHQMPVYQCQETQQWFASYEQPKNCPKCGKCVPKQSEDVFDTWFSSALWPFAVLGWPDKNSQDFKDFYPTSTLSTARDIINLWVARMIYSGFEFTGQKPFDDVIFHATILTKDGKRMSKSLGTGIDPMLFIEKYGADATRLGLAWQVSELQDIRFSEDAIIAGKKFCNKLWNATRFSLLGLEEGKQYDISVKPIAKTENDKQILTAFENICQSTHESIAKYQMGKGIRDLYDFFWHDFCDKYIEQSKLQIADAKNPADKENTQKILLYVLDGSLKLMHPFIPFITEELYGLLPITGKAKALIVAPWPVAFSEKQIAPTTKERKSKVIKKKIIKKVSKKPVKKIAKKVKIKKIAKKHGKRKK